MCLISILLWSKGISTLSHLTISDLKSLVPEKPVNMWLIINAGLKKTMGCIMYGMGMGVHGRQSIERKKHLFYLAFYFMLLLSL